MSGHILLSKRQEECLSLVALGKTSKQIGRALNLSPSTVDNHIQAAMERLGASYRSEAVQIFSVYKQSIEQDFEGDLSVNSSLEHASKAHDSAPPKKRRIFQSVPLGGQRNSLSTRERFIAMLQIAMLATLIFAAVTLTIGGLIYIAEFTPRATK